MKATKSAVRGGGWGKPKFLRGAAYKKKRNLHARAQKTMGYLNKMRKQCMKDFSQPWKKVKRMLSGDKLRQVGKQPAADTIEQPPAADPPAPAQAPQVSQVQAQTPLDPATRNVWGVIRNAVHATARLSNAVKASQEPKQTTDIQVPAKAEWNPCKRSPSPPPATAPKPPIPHFKPKVLAKKLKVEKKIEKKKKKVEKKLDTL